MIVVFAGRRIDADGAGAGQFPLRNVPRVQREIERFLEARQPAALVGSAACGADLLVLDAAHRLGIRSRVVLPFERTVFRGISVTDRPGDWGPVFDRLVAAADASNELVELRLDPNSASAYQRANDEIFAQAERLAAGNEPLAALVLWNGQSRGSQDVTEAFREEARRRGWPTSDIQTADPGSTVLRTGSHLT
jgi:hypothetical protein